MSILSTWAKKIKKFFNKKETKDALAEAAKFLKDSGLLITLINPMVEKVVVNSLMAKGIPQNKAELFANAAISMVAESVDSRDPKSVAIAKLKEKIADPDVEKKLIVLAVDSANLPPAGATIGATVIINEVQRLLDCL